MLPANPQNIPYLLAIERIWWNRDVKFLVLSLMPLLSVPFLQRATCSPSNPIANGNQWTILPAWALHTGLTRKGNTWYISVTICQIYQPWSTSSKFVINCLSLLFLCLYFFFFLFYTLLPWSQHRELKRSSKRWTSYI